jgi:hypothetical protein
MTEHEDENSLEDSTESIPLGSFEIQDYANRLSVTADNVNSYDVIYLLERAYEIRKENPQYQRSNPATAAMGIIILAIAIAALIGSTIGIIRDYPKLHQQITQPIMENNK